jgi:hypothetical protein
MQLCHSGAIILFMLNTTCFLSVAGLGISADLERSSLSDQSDDVGVWQKMLNNPNEWSRGAVLLQQ